MVSDRVQKRFRYLQLWLSRVNCNWPEEKGEFLHGEQHYATQADCRELHHHCACFPSPPRLKLRTVKVKLEFQSGRFRVDLGKQSLCCSFAAAESFDFPRSEAAKEVWS